MFMNVADFLEEWNNDNTFVEVHTSGSTGKPKIIRAEKERMVASAEMTCDFLHLKKGDSALLCMDLRHIGAKMIVVRSIVRELRLIEVAACGHPLAGLSEVPDFAAMVPLQVYNSLQNEIERESLKKIKNLIIGGGAIDDRMLAELKGFPNAVWSTYGMTETLSHIALRRLNGDTASDWYTPFEGVRLRLNEQGRLCIYAPSVCEVELVTNDVAHINENGCFQIIGRSDNTINSGGVKIQIEEVEKLLGQTPTSEFAIGALPDEKFGQIIALLTTDYAYSNIRDRINILPKYWIPRKVVFCDVLPRTINGKIDRKGVEELLRKGSL